ncbi:DUF6386 family protein [Enterobacter roggenkampii]|uniref:DUF6386 family protein n=1 Tax=Enterobacter roggenkampii TaxID=1812935 RepID=UPI003D226CC8
MMSLWDALRMNMMISYQELVRTFLNEDVDWWSLPEDEVEEVNKGNVLFLNLGDDGAYKVNIKKIYLKTCLE